MPHDSNTGTTLWEHFPVLGAFFRLHHGKLQTAPTTENDLMIRNSIADVDFDSLAPEEAAEARKIAARLAEPSRRDMTAFRENFGADNR